MGWFLATSDLPGRPFAVIDDDGAVAGCHATRQMATMQMTQLNMEGLTAADIGKLPPSATIAADAAEPEAKSKESAGPPAYIPPEPPTLGKPAAPDSTVSYSRPRTMMW